MLAKFMLFSAALLAAIFLFGPALPALAGEENKGRDHGDVVTITADEIKKLNVYSVVELLNLVPGVKASETTVGIRGSYAVKVFLDGAPLKNPVSAHSEVKLGLVNLANLDKVKIIKGGGAVDYGDDSSGGVVLFYTKKTRKAVSGRIEAGGGNQGSGKAGANLSTTAGRWSLSASGEYYRTDGFRNNGDKETIQAGFKAGYDPDAPREGEGDGASPAKKSDWQPVVLSLDYGKRTRGNPGYRECPTPDSRARDETLRGSLTYGWKNIKAGTHYLHFENESWYENSDYQTIMTGWKVKQDIRAQVGLPVLGRLSLGMEAENIHGEGNKMEDRDEQTLGFFAKKQVEFDFAPLGVSLGLRASLYSEFDAAVNPEVQVRYAPSPLEFVFSAAMSNNVPTLRQRYYESSTLVPNPDLDMEQSVNLSLRAAFQPNKKFRIGASLFYDLIDDRITYTYIEGNLGQYQNIGRAYYRGVDASLEIKPRDWLELHGSYTYLEARDETNDLWLSCKPRHKVKADLRLRPAKRLMLALSFTFQDESYSRSDNSEIAPSFYLFDLRAEYAWEGWRLYLRLDNLLDKEYLYCDGYPAPPFTIMAGMVYSF